MQNRIRELRKQKGLNQTEFGAKIGLSQRAIANLESGSTLTERNFNAICKAFDVNPEWLREGVGEMFRNSREVIIRSVAEEFELDEPETNLIRAFLELSSENRRGVLAWAKKFAATMAIELEVERSRQKTDNELTREEKHAMLDAELDTEEHAKKTGLATSSAFTGTSGSKKKFSTNT